MHTVRDESELTFDGMMARVSGHLGAIFRFPSAWGIRDSVCSVAMPSPAAQGDLRQRSRLCGAPHEHSEGAAAPSPDKVRGGIRGEPLRPRLFRYDAKRLKRMILGAEHMLRCLIIWKAFRVMREGEIKPSRERFPTPPTSSAPREPAPPVHPHFKLRALPLYDPKAPPFRISMPSEFKSPAAGQENAWGEIESKQYAPRPSSILRKNRRRPRNDTVSREERLYLQLDRLSDIYDSIDTRGARLAARWAGWLRASHEERPDPPRSFGPLPLSKGESEAGALATPPLEKGRDRWGSDYPRDHTPTKPGNQTPKSSPQPNPSGSPEPASGEAGGLLRAALSATHREVRGIAPDAAGGSLR